jgi:uncharacterized membrane protein
MHVDDVIAILVMAIATYATRIGGVLVGGYLPKSGPARRALDALPAAVLTAVVAPAIVAGWAEVIADVVTLLAALRLPMVVAVVLGIVAVALGRAAGL